MGQFHKNKGGSQYTSRNIMVLIMGTPNKVPLVVGSWNLRKPRQLQDSERLVGLSVLWVVARLLRTAATGHSSLCYLEGPADFVSMLTNSTSHAITI